MAGKAIVVPGADWRGERAGYPAVQLPLIEGWKSGMSADKYTQASGIIVDPLAPADGTGDPTLVAGHTAPTKAARVILGGKSALVYSKTARSALQAPFKFTQNKWSFAFVYSNEQINVGQGINVIRSLVSLVNSTNTEAILIQPTCPNSVFRVVRVTGTIVPLVSATGTTTIFEATFVHALAAKGIAIVTYDGANLKIFNGATQSVSLALVSPLTQGTLYVGPDIRSNQPTAGDMEGAIAQIQYFDKALTQAEVTSVYNTLNAAYS